MECFASLCSILSNDDIYDSVEGGGWVQHNLYLWCSSSAALVNHCAISCQMVFLYGHRVIEFILIETQHGDKCLEVHKM